MTLSPRDDARNDNARNDSNDNAANSNTSDKEMRQEVDDARQRQVRAFSRGREFESGRTMKGIFYQVVLIDPQGEAAPELRYRAQSRDEAEAWTHAWEEEPLGLVAVVWPSWARLPGGCVDGLSNAAEAASRSETTGWGDGRRVFERSADRPE